MAISRKYRSALLRQLHHWHWISSALSLIGMLLFAITGLTLNHAGSIEASITTERRSETLPVQFLVLLDKPRADMTLPSAVSYWISDMLAVNVNHRPAEWSVDEVYVSLPQPGGDAWLSIDRRSGEVEYERTDRGWISYFNDLHKGRNTGPWWSWFIDVFAVASVVFSLTGLLLLWLHARNRPTTWPLVGLGALIPLILMFLFIH